jgi:chromosome partitioning protein
MKTLVIASQKGGVAKTTTTTELALAATNAGLAVAVIDTDPQATSCFWAEARKLSNGGKPLPDGQEQIDIAVSPVFPALLPSRIKALEATGCDLVIIDTPAVSKDTASAAMRLADFVLIPTKPAAFDLRSMLETIEQARALDKPYAIVLTMCPPQRSAASGQQGSVELTATLSRMAELHHEICPVLMHQYVAYPRAQKHGLSVQEIDPDGKAAAEVRELYAYTCRRLDIATGRRTTAAA